MPTPKTKTDGVERRVLDGAEVRVSCRDDGRPIIAGYAAVYDKLSEDLGGFREVVRPGAFTRFLAGKPDVRGLYNHSPAHLLGRTLSGTLRLADDKRGLGYEIEPPAARVDVTEAIERGDVTGSSFSFRVAAGGDLWHEDDNDTGLLREITDVEFVLDVGPVVFPAYPDTTAASRSLEAWRAEQGPQPTFDAGQRDRLRRERLRRMDDKKRFDRLPG